MKIQLSDHFTYKRLARFVLPSIVMMVFTSIYGVVDGLFVSNFVGDTAFCRHQPRDAPSIRSSADWLYARHRGQRAGCQNARRTEQRARQPLFFHDDLGIGHRGRRFIGRRSGDHAARRAFAGGYGRHAPALRSVRAITMGFTISFMLQYAFQAFLIAAEKPKLGLASTVAAG